MYSAFQDVRPKKPEECCFSVFYSVTLNVDLLTPKSEAFISVYKCIVIIRLVKIRLTLFKNRVENVWDARTHE